MLRRNHFYTGLKIKKCCLLINMGSFGKPYQPPGTKPEKKTSSQRKGREKTDKKKKKTRGRPRRQDVLVNQVIELRRKKATKPPRVENLDSGVEESKNEPELTFFGDQSSFICGRSLSPLEALTRALSDSTITSDKAEKTQSELGEEILPSSHKQVSETGEVLEKFEIWKNT